MLCRLQIVLLLWGGVVFDLHCTVVLPSQGQQPLTYRIWMHLSVPPWPTHRSHSSLQTRRSLALHLPRLTLPHTTAAQDYPAYDAQFPGHKLSTLLYRPSPSHTVTATATLCDMSNPWPHLPPLCSPAVPSGSCFAVPRVDAPPEGGPAHFPGVLHALLMPPQGAVLSGRACERHLRPLGLRPFARVVFHYLRRVWFSCAAPLALCTFAGCPCHVF